MTNEIAISQHRSNLMAEYRNLRKLAVSYWNFFAFSASYCLLFPFVNTLNKSSNRAKVLFSLLLAFNCSNFVTRVCTKRFNREEFEKFKTFCLKNGMEEEFLF